MKAECDLAKLKSRKNPYASKLKKSVTMRLLQIRQFQDVDSIVELTSLLHKAYARLGDMGLNYTAVDQTPEVTAKRMLGGVCFVFSFSYLL